MTIATALRRGGQGTSADRKWMLAFAAVVLLCAFTPAAPVLLILAPLGTLYLSFRFVRKAPGLYVEFVCWLYFCCSFVRRVAEMHGTPAANSLLAVPLVALLACVFHVLARWTRLPSRSTAPFGYVLAGITYGALLAGLQFRFAALGATLPLWLLPAVFGLYVFTERAHLDEMYAGFESAMVRGILLAGVYGVIQYMYLPVWDARWMQAAELVSIGKPEPMEVRVFSILNAPQVLGAFMSLGIFVAYRSRIPWRWLAMAAGFVGLVLSSARSAWVALAVALLYYVLRGTARERSRMIVMAGAATVLLIGLSQMPVVGESLTARFASLTDGQHDDSAADRSETYGRVLAEIASSPFGRGIGVDDGVEDAEHDSSIVNMVLCLGVFGSIVFLAGLGVMTAKVLLPKRRLRDSPLLAVQACLVFVWAEVPLNNVLSGPIAFLMWTVVGFGLALVLQERSARAANLFQMQQLTPALRHG